VIPVGLSLQPDVVFLDLLHDVIRDDADYYELAPETLWYRSPSGALEPNGFHRMFRELVDATRKPVVAHGVGLSIGGASAADSARRASWLERIRADHEVFRFGWYTDHLGVSALGGLATTLPLAVPMTDAAVMRARGVLETLQRIVPDVGVENSVFYFHLGDPLDEPAFLRRIVAAPGLHVLLDLHNVYTTALNNGFDPRAYLARLPLEAVIEIHLSGGSESPASWLGGRSLRLDSHDTAVPEPVWALFDEVWPRCPNLRGVTLERMEDTVTVPDVAVVRAELLRARGARRRADRGRPVRRADRRDARSAALAGGARSACGHRRGRLSSLRAARRAAPVRAPASRPSGRSRVARPRRRRLHRDVPPIPRRRAADRVLPAGRGTRVHCMARRERLKPCEVDPRSEREQRAPDGLGCSRGRRRRVRSMFHTHMRVRLERDDRARCARQRRVVANIAQ
jgi:uncharacterized protein